MSDYIYFPIYEAVWAGLGIGACIVIVCAVLCAIGLYIFLAVTEPRESRR